MKSILLPCLTIAAVVLFSGCDNDDPMPEPVDFTRGVYIVNEGSFQSNNGSISYYDPVEGLIINNIFEAVNKRPLGDVVQSMAVISDTTGIIIVNGSAKMEVVDLRTFATITEPIPVVYPRYFKQVTDDQGYLTGGNLQGYVYRIDLKTFTMVDSIRVGYGPESLVQLNDLVYVANSGGWGVDSTIHKINVNFDLPVDTFFVGKAPVDMVFDGSDYLWVYCKGQAIYNWDPPYNLIAETDALLQKIDVSTGTVLYQAKIGKAGDYTATPPRIAASPDGEMIYYLRPDGVYSLHADSPVIPVTPLITGSYYGLDVNPDDGRLYVFESSFTGNGVMKIHDADGTLLAEGMVGIAPNGAVFH